MLASKRVPSDDDDDDWSPSTDARWLLYCAILLVIVASPRDRRYGATHANGTTAAGRVCIGGIGRASPERNRRGVRPKRAAMSIYSESERVPLRQRLGLRPKASAPVTEPVALAGESLVEEVAILSLLDAPPTPFVPIQQAFNVKEAALRQLFAQLAAADRASLHDRLSVRRDGDVLAARFARLALDRRERLLAALEPKEADHGRR